MAAVWLYAADGRKLYYVYVRLPMQPYLAHAGQFFGWNAVAQRYEITYGPMPAEVSYGHPAPIDAPEAGKEHYPK